MNIIGKILHELRVDHDLTQQQVADIIKVDQSQYSRYERGENDISFQAAITLSKFYNVPLNYLSGIAYDRSINNHDEEEWLNIIDNYTYEQLFVDVAVLSETDRTILIRFIKFLRTDKSE